MTALLMGTAVTAQQDLAVSFNQITTPTSSADPLDLSFFLVNNGDSIAPGDTLYYALVVGTTFYTVDLATSGSVSGSIVGAGGLPNGFGYDITVPTKTMDEMYALLGGLTGDVCAVALGIGSASIGNAFADDATAADNSTCTAYTVTAVTGIEDEVISEISAYPNPVVNSLTIALGNNTAESINIIDMTGRTVETIAVSNGTETVDMSNYNNGVYFYQVVSNGVAIKTEKFIVAK